MDTIAMRDYQVKLDDKNWGSDRLLEGVPYLHYAPCFLCGYTSNSPSKVVFEMDDLGLHSYGFPLIDGF